MSNMEGVGMSANSGLTKDQFDVYEFVLLGAMGRGKRDPNGHGLVYFDDLKIILNLAKEVYGEDLGKS